MDGWNNWDMLPWINHRRGERDRIQSLILCIVCCAKKKFPLSLALSLRASYMCVGQRKKERNDASEKSTILLWTSVIKRGSLYVVQGLEEKR